MIKKISKNVARQKRHLRIRNKISGTPECPRLSVYRSNSHMHVQIIDDSSSTLALKLQNCGNVEGAKLVGADIAKKALQANIKKVVFDRSGYLYTGRVKALAEAARENGLEF